MWTASKTPGLQDVAKAVARLGAAGMSSDESDGDAGEGLEVFKIHPRLERAAWVTRLVRGLDGIHLRQRQTGSRYGGKTQGHLPHVRRLGDVYSKAPAVPGLRENYYSRSFLSGLTQQRVDELNIKEPQDVHIAPAYRRFVQVHFYDNHKLPDCVKYSYLT